MTDPIPTQQFRLRALHNGMFEIHMVPIHGEPIAFTFPADGVVSLIDALQKALPQLRIPFDRIPLDLPSGWSTARLGTETDISRLTNIDLGPQGSVLVAVTGSPPVVCIQFGTPDRRGFDIHLNAAALRPLVGSLSRALAAIEGDVAPPPSDAPIH